MEKIIFTQEKETKNTIRYQEVSDAPAIGSLYLQKFAWVNLGKPAQITITIDTK
jgi:hypothetical protein